MADTPKDDTAPLPPELRFLKTLVTILTAAMILGVIAVVAVLVIRLNNPAPILVLDPGDLELPDGVALTGYALWEGHAVTVADDGMIRVFDAETGALVETHALPEG